MIASQSPAAPPRDVCINVTSNPNNSGKGFFGWLGRQVGYVRKAVRTDVENPALPATPPKVLYQNTIVEEAADPRDPNVKLRRTVIDEAIKEQT